MYGIFTYIYHKNRPNVGKYTIHGSFEIFFQVEQMGFQHFQVEVNVPNIAIFRPSVFFEKIQGPGVRRIWKRPKTPWICYPSLDVLLEV